MFLLPNCLCEDRTAGAGTARQALLFLVDISGFTDLIHQTSVEEGRRITQRLLSAILHQNRLGLQVAEIERDAVFFYTFNTSITNWEILHQYHIMLNAFQQELSTLHRVSGHRYAVSLKMIVHQGPVVMYKLGQFRKLYGRAVVEAHQLLKNAVPGNTYALLTDALSNQNAVILADEVYQGITATHLCEIDGAERKLCFIYYDFGPLSENRLLQTA